MSEPPPPAWQRWLAASVVILVTISIRVPSCHESFWVDELHSAWSIWDSFPEVFPRAKVGHQMPGYFVGLWAWKQCFGESEFVLRMSSVLAVAAAAAILTLAVSHWTNRLAAGLAAGLVLALEENSLFFGTELRPYAFVILWSAVAVACFLKLWPTRTRHVAQAAWCGLIVAILGGLLTHPTSLGVTAWLPAVLGLRWLRRDLRAAVRFSLMDGGLVIASAAVVFTLWEYELKDTWHQREIWRSFASADSVWKLWLDWPWTSLLLLPLGAFALAQLLTWRPPRGGALAEPREQEIAGAIVALSMIAIGSILLFWLLARCEILAVWHRRYFIAVLPIFASLIGGVVAASSRASIDSSPLARISGWLVAVLLVGALTVTQGTLRRWLMPPHVTVRRGEDWRGAIDWVTRTTANESPLVFVDAGLIEGRTLVTGFRSPALPATLPTDDHIRYLTYPLRGPYRMNRLDGTSPRRTTVLPCEASLRLPSEYRGVASKRVILITRRRPTQLPKKLLGPQSRVHGFGRVTVVRLREGADFDELQPTLDQPLLPSGN